MLGKRSAIGLMFLLPCSASLRSSNGTSARLRLFSNPSSFTLSINGDPGTHYSSTDAPEIRIGQQNPDRSATERTWGGLLTTSASLFQEPSPDAASRKVQDADGAQRGYSLRVNVDSVFLNVAVQERSTNRSVAGLKKEDFLVYEDGILQQVEQFLPSEAPLSLLLLLDVSGSAGFRLRLMKEASIDFIRGIKPNDRVAIAAFSSRVDLVQSFTNDRSKAEQTIQEIWAGGGTSFYDALMACLNQYMRGVEGRSAIVVFTDGIDNQLEGGYPAGSETTFEELFREVQEREPIIYTIFLDTVGLTAGGGVSPGERSRERYPSQKGNRIPDPTTTGPDSSLPGELAAYAVAMRQLKAIADQTGGRMYSPRKVGELSAIYSEIARDLGIQYQLGYNPTNRVQDGSWREIRVKVKAHPEAVVRTRKGYYARKEGGK